MDADLIERMAEIYKEQIVALSPSEIKLMSEDDVDETDWISSVIFDGINFWPKLDNQFQKEEMNIQLSVRILAENRVRCWEKF